jgi:selenide,water dikinase
VSPAALGKILPGFSHEAGGDVIVGLDHPDDAGIVRLSAEIALIHTVDFFTPIVDDPYLYGQIAAANSLSDVYAMGGTPLSALNLLCFPAAKLGGEAVEGILAGGRDKAHEAGCPIIGGQTVEDRELKYGLAVTGRIHPDRILLKRGARSGDLLVLTKPLGVGLLTSGFKAGVGDNKLIAEAARTMATLSAVPSRLALRFGARAGTDITGFGLLGHASEMVHGDAMGFRIHSAEIPRFAEAEGKRYRKLRTKADRTNREYTANVVTVSDAVPDALAAILYDPQTSGGLLVALPPDQATPFLSALREEGYDLPAAVIGEVTAERPGRIVVT